ncbi:Late histone H2B.L4-like protein [Aphelenchoides fujianensis]|nr:Late histone H2B.L4-like protein [Aphelenchoides fujianensis]
MSLNLSESSSTGPDVPFLSDTSVLAGEASERSGAENSGFREAPQTPAPTTAVHEQTDEAPATRQPARRRGGTKQNESFKRYVKMVLKQTCPDLDITGKALDVMDSFLADMFHRFVVEATALAKQRGRSTLRTEDLEAAVRLVLPGELAKHAHSDGKKALVRYALSTAKEAD